MNTATARHSETSGSALKQRGRWLQTALTWHWVSSALALTGMLMFAVTGFTLNHAADISASPEVTTLEVLLPEVVTNTLVEATGDGSNPLPEKFLAWLKQEHQLSVSHGTLEWSETEVYISMPEAGGDSWLAVELPEGLLTYESTDRGWIAYLNDLHKGRNTGAAWSWFIDLFALVCLVFCFTGFLVLWLHSRERIAVWPVTGLGLLIPVVLALLFIH